MKCHKDLDVWNIAMELAVMVYKLIDKFPKTEMFGLTNQMRRAAVSIPSNIAEGAARQTNKEFAQFLYIALGSNQSLRLNCCSPEKLATLMILLLLKPKLKIQED